MQLLPRCLPLPLQRLGAFPEGHGHGPRRLQLGAQTRAAVALRLQGRGELLQASLRPRDRFRRRLELRCVLGAAGVRLALQPLKPLRDVRQLAQALLLARQRLP